MSSVLMGLTLGDNENNSEMDSSDGSIPCKCSKATELYTRNG